MLEDADVMLENFKPGTLDKWGISYSAVLKHRFPRLIHCSVTGFGQTGPYSRFPGYDAMGQAFGGIMSFNGSPEDDAGRVAVSVADLTSTGMAAMPLALSSAPGTRMVFHCGCQMAAPILLDEQSRCAPTTTTVFGSFDPGIIAITLKSGMVSYGFCASVMKKVSN